MKKKKSDLKKIALMGLTGGLLLSAPGIAASESTEGQNEFFTNNASELGTRVAAGCGGASGGCGGKRQSSFGYVGSRNSQPSQGSCGAAHRPVQGGSCGAARQPVEGENFGASQPAQLGFSGTRSSQSSNTYTQGNQVSNSSQKPSQGYYADNIAPSKNILDNEHERQDADKANVPHKNGGYIADNDVIMGADRKRMEQEAGKMNPQSPKPLNSKALIAESDSIVTQKIALTEQELMKHLSVQGKAAYQNLTPEGKLLALQLAGESKSADKDHAITAAAAKMAEKRNTAMQNPTPVR